MVARRRAPLRRRRRFGSSTRPRSCPPAPARRARTRSWNARGLTLTQRREEVRDILIRWALVLGLARPQHRALTIAAAETDLRLPQERLRPADGTRPVEQRDRSQHPHREVPHLERLGQ